MKKKIKIIIFIIIFLYILSNKDYAKYYFEYKLNCFDLIIQKDVEPPEYEIWYSTKEWTNQDVLVKIKFSEEINGVEGFEYNKGYYERWCTENEIKSFTVSDFAGNETIVKYKVNNIDKIPPSIIGIENGNIYESIQSANYKDYESGIKDIQKIYYGDLLLECNEDYYSTASKNGIDINLDSIKLKVTRAPKNIVKYKFYRIDETNQNFIESTQPQIIYKNNSKKAYKYYVIGIDSNGKNYKSNIISRKGTYFQNIQLNKNNEIANLSIIGLQKEVSKIDYQIISLKNNQVKKGEMLNNNLQINKNDFDNSENYKIVLKFYSETQIIDQRNVYINLNENYVEEKNNIFSKSGNYDIKIVDNAGNECLYTITIK